MSNMSYCRFRNTSSDLIDCENVLEDLVNGTKHEISDDELDAASRLIRRCQNIAEMFEDCHSAKDVMAELKRMIDEARFEAD